MYPEDGQAVEPRNMIIWPSLSMMRFYSNESSTHILLSCSLKDFRLSWFGAFVLVRSRHSARTLARCLHDICIHHHPFEVEVEVRSRWVAVKAGAVNNATAVALHQAFVLLALPDRRLLDRDDDNTNIESTQTS